MSASSQLEGRRCLVTGGSRNLGRAICEALAKRGARVAFTFLRDGAAADETEERLRRLGTEPMVFRGSVDDAEHAAATVNAIVDAWGGLDVLVNHATQTQIVPIALMEESDWDRAMSVNAKGAFLFSREALRPMLRAKHGHILNIGTFANGRVVSGMPVHFAASKAALKGFTEALAAEVGRYGILVNYLGPGLLDSGLSPRLGPERVAQYVAQAGLQRLGKTVEVAELAAWMISSDNSFMTAASIVADGAL